MHTHLSSQRSDTAQRKRMVSYRKKRYIIHPIVTVKDFVGLQLEKDMKGAYVITGRISKHKRHKWATETGRAIGRQFAFVLNDSIISTPHVITQIDDGSFMISSIFDKDLPTIYPKLVKEKSDSIDAIFSGWEKDSLYYTWTPAQQDSLKMTMDYWEAKAWRLYEIQSLSGFQTVHKQSPGIHCPDVPRFSLQGP